jgi:hypothetical protein
VTASPAADERHIRHVHRHRHLLHDRPLVFDHDDLWLRRFGRRHLNDRRFLDRTRPSAANDRFDHLLADARLLELG